MTRFTEYYAGQLSGIYGERTIASPQHSPHRFTGPRNDGTIFITSKYYYSTCTRTYQKNIIIISEVNDV